MIESYRTVTDEKHISYVEALIAVVPEAEMQEEIEKFQVMNKLHGWTPETVIRKLYREHQSMVVECNRLTSEVGVLRNDVMMLQNDLRSIMRMMTYKADMYEVQTIKSKFGVY